MNVGANMVDHLVMYGPTVQALPFVEQCRAAHLAQCSEITMSPLDYVNYVSAGLNAADLKMIAADHGVTINHLDPLAKWAPISNPGPDSGFEDTTYIDFPENEFFAIAEALECRAFGAIGSYPKGTYSLNEEIDLFGSLCERALQRGLSVSLEFIPFLGIDSLAAAWNIISGVNMPNAGILFDTWHYFRSGSSAELLGTIPGERIFCVQLNDGDAELPPGVSLFEDCTSRRTLPGKGAFEVRDTVALLRQIGGLNNVGPEIFSLELNALSAEEIALRCRTSMNEVLG
jgi:4-hydroxyphenylpyruvate dioxygenase